MKFNYYYNNVPGEGQSRNNLVYTSLIREDNKVFVKWYHNDTEYHQGKNQVVDSLLMQEKWEREMHFLHNMQHHNPDMVPDILEVNVPEKKIYLSIDGVDFWQRADYLQENYNTVLPDWQEQMLAIIQAHKDRGWYKFSMHPSSYFIVDGKLKSINYFFTYSDNEPELSIESVQSHVSTQRQIQLKQFTDKLGLDWSKPYPLKTIQLLTFDCFSNNYPKEFIERAKEIYERN
jgi:hypothetical protein